MKHWILTIGLMGSLTTTLAEPPEPKPLDLGVAEVETLGTLNGQALACRDFDGSKAVKDLVIRRVPKSRRFGIIFETATNAGFLAQSQSGAPCPPEAQRAARLTDLETQLRQIFPLEASAQDGPEPGESNP